MGVSVGLEDRELGVGIIELVGPEFGPECNMLEATW